MSRTTHQKLQETRTSLTHVLADLSHLKADILEAATLDFRQAALVVKNAQELRDSLTSQLSQFCVLLPDGRRLLQPQLDMVETFANNNALNIQQLLTNVTIEDDVIVECDFQALDIKTLEGLKRLWSVRLLDVTGNDSLDSLRGIPTESLQHLFAWRCDLTGDLSALSRATHLRVAFVSQNPRLHSLKGLPTQEMKVLDASACDLSGDLSDLSGAHQLEELCLNENRRLVSLRGIPTPTIQEVHVSGCGLIGDLSELASAMRLKHINIAYNEGLTSLRGLSTENIEFVDARSCRITGDHTFLVTAAHLTELKLEGNRRGLRVDKTKINKGLIISL